MLQYDSEENTLTRKTTSGVHVIFTTSVWFEEYRNDNGDLHNLDGPAVIDYRRAFFGYQTPRKTDNDRGNRPRLEWWLNGNLHREDGPAVMIYKDHIGGELCVEEWYLNGIYGRKDGGPLRITYNTMKERTHEWYGYSEDSGPLLHREDGPAHIDLLCETQTWYRYGIKYRENGPAMVSPIAETWFKDGSVHRRDGPAEIIWDDRSTKFRWRKKGSLHRPRNLPAVLGFTDIDREHWGKIKNINDVYRFGGKITVVQYYRDGINVPGPGGVVSVFGNDIGGPDEVIDRGEWKDENGEHHREDGPAVINHGRVHWYRHGKLHCICGPAVRGRQSSQNEWWVNGRRLSTKIIRPWLKKNKIDLTDEGGQLAFFMMWGNDEEALLQKR